MRGKRLDGQRRHAWGQIRQKRQGGDYYAAYIHDGQRYSAGQGFATRRQAAAWLAKQQTAIREGTWRDPALGGESLHEYALRWLGRRSADLKPRTAKLYASLLDNHILPHLGNVRLTQITPARVEEWQQALADKFAERLAEPNPERPVAAGVTGKTARAQAYRLLRTILNDAVRVGLTETNPCKIPGAGTAKAAERVPPTLAELRIIADAVPSRYKCMVLVAAWGGLRFGELTALTRAGIDLSSGAPKVYVSAGAHRIDGQVVLTEPKSEAGKRTVHLPTALSDELRDHLKRFVPDRQDALVFGTVTGNYLSSANWGKTFRRARHKAGRDDLRFHDLRHLGATLAAQSGATIKELMARLGHSTPDAAMIYQHAAQERDRQLALAMDAAVTADNVVPLRPQTARAGGVR
ncbi:MAG: site-specific integrase [Bifidobacteriaceae bacterium]|jgi:integrase|nr:site-specific integrase [Bifidobacteriaceae bacterium]